jgi:lysyl-tRNA synthetase class 2
VWALAPAFRAGERGRRHAPEFRMLEWYRPGWDERRLAEEVVALLDHLTGLGSAYETVAWAEAFERHAGLDPRTADPAALERALGADAAAARVDGVLDRGLAGDLLLTRLVEPHLGRGRWTVLTGYPAEAAAQARLRTDAAGRTVAARFELYRDGIELANGYWELADGAELAARLAAERALRQDPPDLDQRFLAAVAAGLPDCAGVAVGFDRVAMLALGLDDIAQVQPFAWERA